MAREGPLRLDFEAEKFRVAMERFVRSVRTEAVGPVVRKVALDVVADTMRGIGGLDGYPKRVDTGRYRAAWRIAATSIPGLDPQAEAALLTIEASTPARGIRQIEGLAGADGVADVRDNPRGYAITLRNRVEYGPHVEHGTYKMAGGHHLERALRINRLRLPGELKAHVIALARRRRRLP